jgi:hypothetical protein
MRLPNLTPSFLFRIIVPVAARKPAGKSGPAGKGKKTLPAAALFWLIFIIVVTSLFLGNWETIRRNFVFLTQRLNLTAAPLPEEEETPPPPDPAPVPPPAPPPSAVTPPPVEPEKPPAVPPPPAPNTGAPPAAQPPAARTPPAPPPSPPKPESPAPKPAETRERNIYFTQVDNDGVILQIKANRRLTLSDSPMEDSLNALLAGPTADEQRRGLVSLIPANTRILSITVRGSTAYISFSEDFQYNTYGVEGYAAQLKQIVWTATEFPTVQDVQILIEGRRVDYLGEGIWIGSPIDKNSF